MDNKITNIKERILYVAKFKGFSIEDFCNKIGMSYGNFKGKHKYSPINSNAIDTIISIIPDVNALWLINGEGEMINNENTKQKKQGPVELSVKDLIYKDILAEKDNEIAKLNKEIGKLQCMLEHLKKMVKILVITWRPNLN